jgi:hypothetical protein
VANTTKDFNKLRNIKENLFLLDRPHALLLIYPSPAKTNVRKGIEGVFNLNILKFCSRCLSTTYITLSFTLEGKIP